MNATPIASTDFKDAYHELVVSGSSVDATEVEARTMMTSTRELVRTISEHVLTDAKTGKTAKEQAAQMAKVGQTEWPKIKYYAVGFTLDILIRSAPALRKLAKAQPRTFGWIIAVLDYIEPSDDLPK